MSSSDIADPTIDVSDHQSSKHVNHDRAMLQQVVIIVPGGDVVLAISHELATSIAVSRFRVHSSSLIERSKYFARLLRGRFGESEKIEREHAILRLRHGDLGKVPSNELPVISIENVGQISTVKSIEPLCKDFLCMLHDQDMTTNPPIANLANLAIVADRFDALEAMSRYMQRKKIILAIDAKTTPKIDGTLSEEKVRQRLLIGALFGFGPWLERYSHRIITRGWIGKDSSITEALWWNLPPRLEQELAVRREGILETVQSIQTHFVKLFISRERQCRLGYDSSMQCDIFQLGQTVRFLDRIGTLQVQGTISEVDPMEAFDGDIYTLIDTLRQCPEYQIDSHHTHCGPRTKLIPLLNLTTEYLQHVGICAECWSCNRADHAWSLAKRPLLWKPNLQRLGRMGHEEAHNNVRAFFTASERDWSA